MVTWLLTLALLAPWPVFSILCTTLFPFHSGLGGRQPLSSLLLTSPGHHSQESLLLPRFTLTTEEQATQRSNRRDLGYNRPMMGSAPPPRYVFNHNGQNPLEKISLLAGMLAERPASQSKNHQLQLHQTSMHNGSKI